MIASFAPLILSYASHRTDGLLGASICDREGVVVAQAAAEEGVVGADATADMAVAFSMAADQLKVC